ncbi:MAG: hypothetical protein R3B70_08375 [Polyangiaceae bacterium]
MISFVSQGKLRDEEWSMLVRDIQGKPITRYLNLSIGSVEVNSLQRKAMIDVLNARKISVIVVSDDRIVRGLVTAAHWLGVDVQAFGWEDLNKAVEKLRIPSPVIPRVLELVQQLKLEAA